MSVIQEQRESILKNNNTAQTTLLDILKDIKPDIIELNIKTPLQGELDLSVLSDANLVRLTTIVLGEGEITGIHNIPRRISKLICSKNLLIELTDLPGGLLYLDCAHNYLTELDLSKVAYIEEVHCEDNKITGFDILPTSLKALYCDKNELKQLNLKGLPNLKTLHISNNPLVIVSNLPETIHDFVSENNPIQMITDVDDGEVESPDKKIDYMEALNEYFKLKSNYEQKLREKRRKEYHKGSDKKDKVRRVSTVKPKCVNCHRPVGTIFATDANGYTAICGDKNSPCKLNIKLLRGNFEPHEAILTEFKSSIDDVKERIIKLKMFTLFNYISEATSTKQFKKELDEYNTFSAVYKDELHKFNELYNSSHKSDLIRSKSSAIHEIQLTIRKLLDDYEKTDNSELLKTAIYTYKTDLMPEIANLSRFKYDITEMNNNETESVLFQSEVALSKSEYIYGEHPSVDKYVMN